MNTLRGLATLMKMKINSSLSTILLKGQETKKNGGNLYPKWTKKISCLLVDVEILHIQTTKCSFFISKSNMEESHRQAQLLDIIRPGNKKSQITTIEL